MIHLCAIAKNEERYLKDWVDYHRNIGFDCIHLFDNGGNGDLSYISKYVNIYNAIGKQTIQLPAYQQIIDWLPKDDYCLFIDVDEFVEYNTLISALIRNCDDFDVMKLSWQVYGDNGLDNYEDKPVWERFKNPSPKDCVYNDTLPNGYTENNHTKSLFHKTNKFAKCVSPHTIFVENGVYINALNERTDSSPFDKVVWNNLYLKHYLTKSKQEWCERRLNKVDACGNRIPDENLIRYYENLNGRSPV